MSKKTAKVVGTLLLGWSLLAQSAQGLYWRNVVTGENYQHQLVQGQLRSQGDLPKVVAPWILAGSGDFNADGEDDLFWRNQTTGETAIQWMKQGQHQSFSDFIRAADLNWQVAAIGDLNGDGIDDLVWQYKTSGQLYLWLMGPTALKWEASLFKISDANWQLRFARDFDGDGKADLLFRNKTTGGNYLFLMDTATVRQQQDVQAVKDLNWQLVAAADLNGDKKTDLLWRNQTTGENYGFYMNGARVISEVALPKVADVRWQVRALTDLNGDGKADLLWWHSQSYQVVEWLMNGPTKLAESLLFTVTKDWQLQFARAIKPAYLGEPVAVPGRIQAEYYDRDGAGYGFADSDTQNQGDSKLRGDGVDIETTTDTGGGLNVGYIANGEWLKYTVKVAKAGNYKLVARVAGGDSTGQMHLEQQGKNLTGAISVAPTGGWQTWANLESPVFKLTAGEQSLKLVFDKGWFNLNYFELVEVEADTQIPSQPTALVVSQLASNSLNLSWTASSDNKAVGYYQVLLNDVVVATSTTTSFNLTNLLPKTNYNLSLRAVDSSGNLSLVSAVMKVTTPDTPQTPEFGQRLIDTHKVANFNQYITEDFVLFWPYPTRAYPGLPIDFQFIVYEAFKQPLHWEVVSGPTGMSITQDGLLKWTPSSSQLGAQSVTIKVTRQTGESLVKTFTTQVSSSDFIFVALTGNDSANGQLTSPLRTIEAALRRVESGQGKTIYVREGVYKEHYQWEWNGVTAPTRGKAFTADNPLVLSSYPGEHFILDCEFLGHGFYSTASYTIYKNFEVKNAGVGERAGAQIQADNNVIQNVTVRDSKWAVQDNVTGIKVSGKNAVVDRVIAINNQDPTNPHWNSSNYLVYADGELTGAMSNIYILRSQSRDSFTGFKIKHAGPGYRVIIHDCYSEQDRIGFGGSSDFSSVRYSTFKNNAEGNVNLGLTDPTSPVSNGTDQSYTGGSMLVEHNTMINDAASNFSIFDGYSASAIVQKNIMLSKSVSQAQMVAVWNYRDDLSSLRLNFDKNIYFNQNETASTTQLFRLGRNQQSFIEWQAKTYDLNAKVTDPKFIDLNYNINAASAASWGGEFAGANLPLIP